MLSVAGDDTKTASSGELRALEMVRSPHAFWKIALFLLVMVTGGVFALIYVPWQQSVTGSGRVIIFSPMERPQNIEAQIPGRLVALNVVEGQEVNKGDTIATLRDIDSKFLDPQQPRRLREQKRALLARRQAAQSRIAALEKQRAALERSRNAAIPTAGERTRQTEDRLRAAREAQDAAEQTLRTFQEATLPTADERVRQAEERLRAAEQAVVAAKQNLTTSTINRNRVKELFEKTLRSQRDYELAENDYVKNRTEVERAETAVEVARRDIKVTHLDRTKAQFDYARARTEVQRAVAATEIAKRDTTVGNFDQTRIANDTAAAISVVEASLAAARETIASTNADLAKLEIEIHNLERRTAQQVVKVPRDGKIVRVIKAGAGETVKAGDVLAVLAPTTEDFVVELTISDNDAPLLAVGRPVRLQFAGWPALQFSGFPSAAFGTFGGRIKVIDAVDDGKSRYRILVEPDRERIAAGKEAPWPSPKYLRPGAEVSGWVMLERVSLGYELWRQFNAFPPTVRREAGEETGKYSGKDSAGKADAKADTKAGKP
jgi:multidrug efflux pump subunit AcrA (membrane-fusion protein)